MTRVTKSIDFYIHYLKAIDVAAFEANEGDFDNSTTEKSGGGGEDEDEGGRRAGPKSEAENSLLAAGASDEPKEENEKENQVTQPTDDFDVTDKDNQVGNGSFSNMFGCYFIKRAPPRPEGVGMGSGIHAT